MTIELKSLFPQFAENMPISADSSNAPLSETAAARFNHPLAQELSPHEAVPEGTQDALNGRIIQLLEQLLNIAGKNAVFSEQIAGLLEQNSPERQLTYC
ncbi:MAG: hypothetical protein IKA87_07145 [Lentisphaeria bacterium]|nr:hypothetical protein [Lentisphaeria bacterium]